MERAYTGATPAQHGRDHNRGEQDPTGTAKPERERDSQDAAGHGCDQVCLLQDGRRLRIVARD